MIKDQIVVAIGSHSLLPYLYSVGKRRGWESNPIGSGTYTIPIGRKVVEKPLVVLVERKIPVAKEINHRLFLLYEKEFSSWESVSPDNLEDLLDHKEPKRKSRPGIEARPETTED
jgi:hypothetical protein